jgi:hypothetical protein
MAQLSLSRAWDDTRDIFSRDGALLVSVALALFVLPETIVGLINPPVGGTTTLTGRLVWLAGALIGLIGQLAMVRLALGPSTTVGQAIAHGARRFLPTVGALLILFIGLALIILPLMILLITTGIIGIPVEGQQPPPSFALFAIVLGALSVFVSVKFTMSVPVSAAEQPGPLEILKRSWRLTRGHYWRLLAFILLLLVTTVILLLAAQFVGGIAAQFIAGRIAPLTLGALVLALIQAMASATATTLFAVMLARLYLQLTDGAPAQPSVPSSGI